MKILHLINDFTTGGAQNALLKLICEDKRSNNNIHTVIIVVNRTDEIFIKLKDNDIQYFFLYDKLDLLSSYRIFKFIITDKPNVLQSWLYISDLLSLLFKLVYPKLKLIWNIRNGQPAKGIISRYSWIAARICSKFSFIPSKIVCPSKASIEYHVDFGYRKSKFVYIPNFIDPVYSEGLISKGLENSKSEVIIFGVVTRFDDQKGIDTLLNAIYQLPPGLNIKFHFIGTGMTKDNVESKLQLLQIPSISYEFCCLEKQKNLFEFYKNIDFHISPSRSEAFPNAVFESMFMGKPNIATNAGDSNFFISDIGFLVDVNDHVALAKAIIKFVKIYNDNFKEYLNLSRRSHEWIDTSFDITEVLKAYNEVWKN